MASSSHPVNASCVKVSSSYRRGSGACPGCRPQVAPGRVIAAGAQSKDVLRVRVRFSSKKPSAAATARSPSQSCPAAPPPGGGGGDDGPEQRGSRDPQDGRPDVKADVVGRLVVRVLDDLVELSTGGGRGQRSGQGALGEGFGDDGRVLPAPLVVQPRADRRVQRAQHEAAGVLYGGRTDPHRAPGGLHQLGLPLRFAEIFRPCRTPRRGVRQASVSDGVTGLGGRRAS